MTASVFCGPLGGHLRGISLPKPFTLLQYVSSLMLLHPRKAEGSQHFTQMRGDERVVLTGARKRRPDGKWSLEGSSTF